MISVETQIHGYRQGHQLIASSLGLSKSDQAIVDRLSDVAGPLRPGERFDPYLTGYPLPSGAYFVLARTWQDLDVPRAGCVRTLSLLIPMGAWEDARGLRPFLDLLDPAVLPTKASSTDVVDVASVALPEAPAFRANELLEALFLEDPKPIALFDAPQPEVIAVRLVTALWPKLRRQFAFGTFALAPRKIEGRDFDLLFAPKDARPKFADWPGRRIDARAGQGARHRWTGEIVGRVFDAASPWLLDDDELALFGADQNATPASLRLALLWDELLAKLENSPSAALGLLDIANSKMQSDSAALAALQPALADAAERAVQSMPPAEAWDLLGAMVRKMHGTRLDSAFPAVAKASAVLAGKTPAKAIAMLEHGDGVDAVERLTPAIASGLADLFGPPAEKALATSNPATLTSLIAADRELARLAVTNPTLVERLASALGKIDARRLASLRGAILDFIVTDQQVALARPLIGALDKPQLLAEVRHLADVNSLAAESYLPILAARSREISADLDLRDALINLKPSSGRDRLIELTLEPTAEDVSWLLNEPRIGTELGQQLLHTLMRGADPASFRDVLAADDLTSGLIESFADGAPDLLARSVRDAHLPLDIYVDIVRALLVSVSDDERPELAKSALGRCLRNHFRGDETAALLGLLEVVGRGLDGDWASHLGLGPGVEASVVARNLSVFNAAPEPARKRMLGAVDQIAHALTDRSSIDLDETSANACANLFWDARSVNRTGLVSAAGRLLPSLLRARRAPISSLIASTFPVVYLELAKHDDMPDLLKFVPFFDWDRCKAARRELVDAFLAAPAWHPRDLALTACRANDAGKILRRVAKAYGGDDYIHLMSADVDDLPDRCRSEIRRTISQIQSDRTAKYDWRD